MPCKSSIVHYSCIVSTPPDDKRICMLLLLKFVRKNTSHEKDCLQSRLFEVARHFRNDWFRKSWRAEPGVTRQITLSGFIPSAIFSVERICARGNRASRQRQARQPTRQPSQPPKASEAAHAQHSVNTCSKLTSVASGTSKFEEDWFPSACGPSCGLHFCWKFVFSSKFFSRLRGSLKEHCVLACALRDFSCWYSIRLP